MNLVNGVASDAVDVRDRGLAYGDGIFRTFPLRGGKALLWPRQYAKLAEDCKALQINCPPLASFESDLGLIRTAEPECVVKIIVTRGAAARGYAMPDQHVTTRVVISSPLPDYPASYAGEGVNVHLCRIRLAAQPALAGIKHLNRLENVLARAEWNDPQIAEGLMRDAADNVICGTMSNLFGVKGGTLFTPALSQSGVNGVMRTLVMDLAREHNVPLRIAAITIDELLAADELFVVNSVVGLWPIAAIERKTWPKGVLTTRLQQLLINAQDH